MRLDSETFRYLSALEWRILISIEMGMRNHEFVPRALIPQIANSKAGGFEASLSTLLRYKLIVHDGQAYDGYKLTYLGYDFLALRTFVARKQLRGIGRRIGVGKESDIHVAENNDGESVIMKIHRLGRISFRTVKKNRDYLRNRTAKNWLYFARLAAGKEYAFLTMLHKADFPVPQPIDLNRHAILMEYIDGYPLYQITNLNDPHKVLEDLMALIVRLAYAGLIHCDFNEFNVMINDFEQVVLIDFPQMVPVSHYNAESFFAHDVECICKFFNSKYGIQVTKFPRLSDLGIAKTARISRNPAILASEPHDFESGDSESDDSESDQPSKHDLNTTALADEMTKRSNADKNSSVHEDSQSTTSSLKSFDKVKRSVDEEKQLSEKGPRLCENAVTTKRKKQTNNRSKVPHRVLLNKKIWKKNKQKAQREVHYAIKDFQD